MKGAKLGLGLVILLGLALPAAAEEIVYFTNGTSMAIRSHTVDREMIRVDLGAGSVMAFPISMVERVEKAGRDVFQGPGYRPTNQAFEGADPGPRAARNTQDATVDGAGNVPSYTRGVPVSPMRAGGDDSYTGLSPDADPTRVGPRSNLGPSRIRRMAGPQMTRPGDPEGTYRVGDSLVLDASPSEKNTKPQQILSLGPREDGLSGQSGSEGPADGEAQTTGGESAPPEAP